MKITALVGLIFAVSMFTAVGPLQAASCYRLTPGWHMVSKKCDIRPAESWQEYNSGVYTQPVGRSFTLIPH